MFVFQIFEATDILIGLIHMFSIEKRWPATLHMTWNGGHMACFMATIYLVILYRMVELICNDIIT